ncbi:MAG: ABC transporter permease [Gemmatimonadetes bacterium]|nr:ABC transporter permease [Gemmatimonadota bacterium]
MGATALALLRAYRRTALLLAAALAVALGAGLPVALARGRLVVDPSRAPLEGLAWNSPVTPPNALRQQAVDGLFGALFGAAGLVVGVAALALIALAAARMAQREREVAVRRAVGASRRMLLGGFLLEGAAIAAVGVAVGLTPGVLLARRLVAAWPEHAVAGGFLPAAVFAAVPLALIVLGALFPLFFARRPEITEPADSGIALRIPSLLLGLSLATLATGVLLTRHMRSLMARGGTDAPETRVYRLTMTSGDLARRGAALDSVLTRLAATPGVTAPSLVQPGALFGLAAASIARADCGPCWPHRFRPRPAAHYYVSADSFDAMGVRLVEGRAFTAADRYAAEPVAIVNAAFAREQFLGSALGQAVMVGDDRDRWYRVIGVVDDPPPRGLGARQRPDYAVYLSILQHPPQAVDLVVPDAAGLDDAIRAALAPIPGLQLAGAAQPVAALLAAEQAPLRWFGPVFSGLGVAMLLLATVGTFALIRLWVLSLSGEIAVWRAVGARRRRVLALLLRRAAGAGLGGVLLGAWLGPLFWEAFRLWLPGLGGWEAGLLLPVATLLLGVAVLGAFLPARELLSQPPVALFGVHED